MSRRHIPTRHPDMHVAVVGWDPPLNTFFGIVEFLPPFDDNDEDGIILWLGGDGTTIANPKDLAKGLELYAELDELTLLRLAADRWINDGMSPNNIADGHAAQALTALGFDAAYDGLMGRTPAPRLVHPTLTQLRAEITAALKTT